MSVPRIIIADPDINYILPLQQKFAEEYWDRVELETITDGDYFRELFSTPQKVDVLIVSEQLYDSSIQKHNISNIFVMSEKQENVTESANVIGIFKYKNIKEIFNIIVGKSDLNPSVQVEKTTKVIYVCSASGGVGKTTLSMAIGNYLTDNYKKVLYVNASHLQSFGSLLKNSTPIQANDFYVRLSVNGTEVYSVARREIIKETFYYLPPFKAALTSFGLSFSVFERLISEAKASNEFDYIIVDSNSSFDENNARLIGIADKVVIVTTQSKDSVFATNNYVSNLSNVTEDKYIFVCNKYDGTKESAFDTAYGNMFSVSEYVWKYDDEKTLDYLTLSRENEVKKISLMLT